MLEKRIKNLPEVIKFHSSLIYKKILNFVLKINTSIKSKTLDTEEISSPVHLEIFNILNRLIDDVKDFDKTEKTSDHKRYGNIHFRDWIDSITPIVKNFNKNLIQKYLPEKSPFVFQFETHGINKINKIDEIEKELTEYFIDSLGERLRLDYGTGHELSFFLYLLSLSELGIILRSDKNKEEMEIHCIMKVFKKYLSLVRNIQFDFRLEPAGSKGVWGLDDYQFLPILFGSSQLIGRPEAYPNSFLKLESELFEEEFLLFGIISFIKKMKTGSLKESSPVIYGLQRFECWERMNKYLLELFEEEVLKPFPVAQHIKFGLILEYK